MGKDRFDGHAARENTMELEDFVRNTLQSIIRGMRDLGAEGYSAEGLSIGGQEARIDFRLSLETMKDGKIYVARIDGKASPNSNRIEFSVKIGHDRTKPPTISIYPPEEPRSVPRT